MKENKKRGIFKPLGAFLLALVMVLTHVVGAMDVQAAGINVKTPTINPVFYDDTTISGGNLAKARVNKKLVIATVHVTLKGEGGTVKATLSDTPTKGTTWKVDLPDGVKVAAGDTVTVYQQIGEDKSPEVTKDAQQSKASTVTLTMPTGEIWIEQTSSNIVNEDEQAEAIEMLKKANPDIANDFDLKKTKFSIDGTNHAYYEVTYTDGSTSGKVEATNLQIQQVKETSRGFNVNDITLVDKTIKGKLQGKGPFDKIKVELILEVSESDRPGFCDGGKCTVDKTSSKPIALTVNKDGSFSYTLQSNDKLELDQVVGISVKEPHKFKSCSTTTVKPVIPEKTEVKDPRELTEKDKKAIDAAIRQAYTTEDDTSKLPNGTGDWDGVPAVIQFDDSGNVKIFSGNDVAGTWDQNNDYKFVPETNDDGSYKIKDGAEPKITIQAKDLVKNIKPEKPAVALSEDKKNITITPNLEVDTDAHMITVSYKDKDGKAQTTIATKADDGTWFITGEGTVVNGVITLPKNMVKGGTDVTATVTDKGGVADDDQDPLTSDPGTLTLEETKPEDPSKPETSDPKKPSAPAITWRGLWYLGEKTEPAKAVQEMEIGRHYKYLYGYVDKTVRPEGMITRSEAAALIARLAELDMTDKTKPNFKDTPSAWYNSAINIMVKKDLMFGDKNGNFRPNEPITRGEFARALYYIDKKNDKVAPFADVKGHEFEAAINQAYGNDRIAGYPDGSFKPNAYIQRAEAARILNQYANRNVNIPGMEGVKKDLIRFTDINENHWAYCEVMEAANSHEYQRAKGSQVETWLRILDIKADWE